MFSDIVDIVAPASVVSSMDLKKSLEFLKKLNLKPRFRGSIRKSSLFAQSEQEAFKNFKKALESKDSCLIWSLRGGYGSLRMLEYLDSLKKKSLVKKVFVGHSDATILHDWIHQTLHWPTLHFPVLREILFTSVSSRNKFKKLLWGGSQITFSNLKLLNKQKNGKIISQITGGNMTLIQSTLGTPWSVSRKGILFLEDVNEKPYRIHRILWQMKHSGVFQKINAVVFGKWQKDSKEIIHQVLKPFFKEFCFPVFVALPCGHGRINDPLPLGTTAKLTWKNGSAELTVKSPFFQRGG